MFNDTIESKEGNASRRKTKKKSDCDESEQTHEQFEYILKSHLVRIPLISHNQFLYRGLPGCLNAVKMLKKRFSVTKSRTQMFTVLCLALIEQIPFP